MQTNQIIIALQFWEGDKEAAMRNARRIADIEPKFREDTEIMFCARFDCEFDEETITYVSLKFKTHRFRSARRGTGWPHGCNELALSSLHEVANRYHTGEWLNFKAAFLMEADCVPVANEWLDYLHAEWDEAASLGKEVAGCWLPFHGKTFGHINGNLLIHPYLVRKRQIQGCAPDVGWDDWVAPQIEGVWFKTGFLKNLYRATEVAEKDILTPWIEGKKVGLIHGVKDLSIENYADKHLIKYPPWVLSDT